jgi:hypothetical protein
VLAILVIAALAVCAAVQRSPLAAGVLGSMAILMALRTAGDAAAAMHCLTDALRAYSDQVSKLPRPASAATEPGVPPQTPAPDQGGLAELEPLLEASAGQT